MPIPIVHAIVIDKSIKPSTPKRSNFSRSNLHSPGVSTNNYKSDI
jgi:hypothetical protein